MTTKKRRTRTLRRLGPMLGLAVGTCFAMGADDNNSCESQPASVEQCTVAADCEGQPHIQCEGQWTCATNQCLWQCGETVPPPDPPDPPADGCFGDGDCKDGLVCNAAEVCLPPPGCGPGDVCPTVCYGQCVKPEVNPPGCGPDQPCEPGFLCREGECIPEPPDLGCTNDLQCGPGSAAIPGTIAMLTGPRVMGIPPAIPCHARGVASRFRRRVLQRSGLWLVRSL